MVLAVGWRNLGCRKPLFGVCVCCEKMTAWGEVPKCSLLMLLDILSSYVAGSISRCMLGIRDTTCPITSLFCACMHVYRLVCGRCGFSGLFMFSCNATDAAPASKRILFVDQVILGCYWDVERFRPRTLT